MKTLPFLRLAAVSLFLTAAASAQFIRVTPSSISFDSTGGARSISINALTGGLEPKPDTWRLDDTLPSWLSLSPTSGRSVDSATLTAAPKSTPGTREFTVHIRSGAGRVDTVAVSQSGVCLPQTISWSLPASAGACESVALGASSTSGLPVSFSRISGPGTINGSTLTFTAPGTVRVRASVAGNASYCASSLERDIVVSKCSQTISFNLPGELQASQIPYPLTASATTGLPVSFEVISGPGVISSGQLSFTDFGSVQVRATQGGNALFAAAPPVTRTTRPLQLSQTITFDPPASVVFDHQTITLHATSSSGGPMTYRVDGPGSVSGNALTVTAPGLLTVTATAEETAFYTGATFTTTIRSFGTDEILDLQRVGFVSNAAGRAGLAEAFLARVLAEFRAIYPLPPGESPPSWPESDLQQAWIDSLPSPAAQIAVSEADFMAWMTTQVSSRTGALANAQAAGSTQRTYQVLTAAVLRAGESYAALSAEAVAAQLEIGTLLGQRTEVRFASFTPTISNSAPDVERGWITQCFERLYDLALVSPTLRDDLATTSLFDTGVAIDADFPQIVDGIFVLVDPAPAPRLRSFLNNVYGIRNPATNGMPAPGEDHPSGFGASDWEMAFADLLGQMVAINNEVDQIREQVVPPTPTEVQQFAAGANKTIKGLGSALDSMAWGLEQFDLVSPSDLEKITQTGNALLKGATTVVDAVEITSKFDTEDLFSVANAALAGNFIGAVSSLASVFLDSQSTEEKILEGIQTIQMQIASLAEYVEARFDGIELQLDAVLDTLVTIQDGLGNLQTDLQGVSAALAAARLQLARFETQTYSSFEALVRQGFSNATADAIDRLPGSLTREEFREAEEAFYTHGVATAKDIVLLPASLLRGDLGENAILLLRDGAPYIYLRTLNDVPVEFLGLPPLIDESLLANPVEWLWAAGAYLSLAEQQPQHLGELETARLTNLIGVGESTRAALARATYWPNGPDNLAEDIFEALITDIEIKAALIHDTLQGIHDDAVPDTNPVRDLLVQHQGWPDNSAFSLETYYALVGDWANDDFYANYLGQDLPTRISPQVQALALAKYIETNGRTLVPGDPFAGASISGANGQQVEDIFCPDHPTRFRRSLTRTWFFRGGNDQLLFRQRFVSDLVYCEGDGVSTEEAFRDLGQAGFFLSHQQEPNPDGSGDTWDETIGRVLTSAFLEQASSFKTEVTNTIRTSAESDGRSDLRLAMDALEDAHALLVAYTAAAFPGSLQTNEALVRLHTGGLFDLARDPRSAILELYPETPGDQAAPPYEGFSLTDDAQVLRDTFHGLLVATAQTGITEADLIFTPVLDKLRRLRDRDNPGTRFDQGIVLESEIPSLLDLNLPVPLRASSTSGLPVSVSISSAAGSYDAVAGELSLLEPAGELVVELTAPPTSYFNAASRTVVYEAFSGIGLSSNTIREEQAVGTAVGNLLDLNMPPAGTFTYALVSGLGDSDNALFAVDGDRVVSNAVFDFETNPGPFLIRVQADNGGGVRVADSLRVLVSNGDSFSDMMESFGVHGEAALPDSDANADGYSNLFAWGMGVAPVNFNGVNPLIGPDSPLPITDVPNGEFTVSFSIPVLRPEGCLYRMDESSTVGDPEDWNPAAQLAPGAHSWQAFNGAAVTVTPQGDRLVVKVTLGGNGSPESRRFARLVLSRPQ